MKKPKFKTPKMYTPWGERAEISQRAFDGKFQLDVFMVNPEVLEEYHSYAPQAISEYLLQGRWVVTHVVDTAEQLLKEVEYR